MQGRPKYKPVPAGIYGAAIAAVVAVAFRFLIIPDPDPSWRATIILTILGFLLPCLYFWNEYRKFNDAVARSYLNEDEN